MDRGGPVLNTGLSGRDNLGFLVDVRETGSVFFDGESDSPSFVRSVSCSPCMGSG